ncbi:MAG TPA: hypothetical protein V6D47_03080 [Oscillatoriaceae cyanobacterium]
MLGLLSGCGVINPNYWASIQTDLQQDVGSYTIAGSLTRGFSSNPKVAYILGEGDSPDPGSFHTRGGNAGQTPQGIYTPTALVPVDGDGRFTLTFTSSMRYVLIHLYAWDDTNNNNIRDVNESLASEFSIKKQDLLGWSYNAPDWNQFNFVFTH